MKRTNRAHQQCDASSGVRGHGAPRDSARTSGINPAELLTSAAVTYFGMAALTKGLTALRRARGEKEMRNIQAQIDRELAALKGGG